MTEAEKKSFFAHATARAPGKRQIKPTAAVLDLVLPADDEDDDEDFIAEIKKESGGESEGGSGSDSGSDSDESSEDEDDDKDIKPDLAGDIALEAIGDGTSHAAMCALCLNLRNNDDIMQCDRCGLTVHESCYLPDVVDDAASTSSSSSTEPWFCEPCAFGFIEPPHCEMCPDRHGAFKRSDIGGRWVHIICALYTTGVTFGDIDSLGAISWQEMDHRNFGKKSCEGCTDKLLARTGVATRCELGLCKNFYHPTCAQRLGLLVDHSDSIDDSTEDAHAVNPRYITCKNHCNPDSVREKRIAYARWFVQEERRMLMIRHRQLSVKEERQRVRARHRREKKHDSLIGVTICWPDASFDEYEKHFRRARHLHTSAKYLEAFQEKAEMVDIDKEQFQQEFLRVKGDSLQFCNPGFSTQYFEYFINRENKVFPAETEKLESTKKANVVIKQRQEDLLQSLKDIEKMAQEKQSEAEKARETLRKMHEALITLGVHKIKLPEILTETSRKNSRGRKLSESSSKSPRSKIGVVLHHCDECKKSTDQHHLIHCDTCKNWFHLACLDPPLQKMPKKLNYFFQCSRCVGSSDSEEHEVASEGDEDVEGGRNKRLRQRNEHAKAVKLAEQEEQNRAFKAAISAAGAPPPRKRGRPPSRPVSEGGSAVPAAKKAKKDVRSPLSKKATNARASLGTVRDLRNGRVSGMSNCADGNGTDEDFVLLDDDEEEL